MAGSADVNRDQLDNAFTLYSTRFQQGLDNMIGYESLTVATEVPSTTSSNEYNFLKKNKKWREWIGDRKVQDTVSEKFKVTNQSWEYTEDVEVDDLNDDNMGLYGINFEEMGMSYNTLRLKEFSNILIDNAATWSGDNLFNATHATKPLYSTTLDNTTTSTLSEAAIEAADATAGSWKYQNNDPVMTRWDTIMVGKSLEKRAWDIFRNRLVDNDGNGGAVDQYFSAGRRFRVIVNPFFTASAGAASNVDAEHYWVLFDTSKPLSSIIFQNREAPRMVEDTKYMDEKNRVYYYGKSRFTYAPTFAHLCYRSTASS